MICYAGGVLTSSANTLKVHMFDKIAGDCMGGLSSGGMDIHKMWNVHDLSKLKLVENWVHIHSQIFVA